MRQYEGLGDLRLSTSGRRQIAVEIRQACYGWLPTDFGSRPGDELSEVFPGGHSLRFYARLRPCDERFGFIQGDEILQVG